LCGVFLSAAEAQAVDSKVGTSAFPFLKINAGARAVGMGGAFTGLADDESSLYYNPAGIGISEKKRFIAGYRNQFADMQSGFAGLIKPIGVETYYLGLALSYLNYGSFAETNLAGDKLDDFSGGNLLFAASIARRVGFNWAVGATGKIIYQKIHEYSASGVALDMGAKFTSNRGRYSFGAAVQNLGTQLSSLGSEKDKLPLTLRIGASLKPRGLPMILASDLIVPNDNSVGIAFGGEYLALEPLFLRLGWNSFGSDSRAADSDDHWAGLSFGVGFDIKESLHFSYAITPAAELGESHRITFTGGM